MDKRNRAMPVRRRMDCGNTMFKDNMESTPNGRSITSICFLRGAETRNLTDRLFSMEVSMDSHATSVDLWSMGPYVQL